MIDNTQALQAAEPEIPDELANRQADNWYLLFAIADLVGATGRAGPAGPPRRYWGPWMTPPGCRCSCWRTSGTSSEQNNLDQIASSNLIGHLISDPEKPWAEYGRRRKEITQRQLAALLRPFNILSGTIHFPGGAP